MSTAGPWELLKRLSTGATGDVFVARPVSGASDRHVAVKRMHPHLVQDRAVLRRFLDEARIAARLQHPNLVQIFDAGTSADGLPWLAMELVEGVSLWTLLEHCRAARAPLPLPAVRLIAKNLCDALSYAHGMKSPEGAELKLVHRDVSPSNVLISKDGVVRLTDFGLARAVGNSSHTSPGALGGVKVGYSAPELGVPGADVDPRADVFSAAVTLFEAATLRHPFRKPGATDAEVSEAVARGDALKAAELVAPLAALDRALRPAPADRFASAQELKHALAGELATPADLAQLVRRHCSVELARFFSLDAVPTEPLAVESVVERGPDSVITRIGKPPTATPRKWGSVAIVAALGAAAVVIAVHPWRDAATSVVQLADLEELELQLDSGTALELPTLAVTPEDAGAH